MKPQFQHTLVTSFYLWFDNYLQKYGEAYKNKTGIFYNMTDDRLDSTYNVYSSPYKSISFCISLKAAPEELAPNKGSAHPPVVSITAVFAACDPTK